MNRNDNELLRVKLHGKMEKSLCLVRNAGKQTEVPGFNKTRSNKLNFFNQDTELKEEFYLT